MLTEQEKVMAKGAMITIPVQLYNALMDESDKLTKALQDLNLANRVNAQLIEKSNTLKQRVAQECQNKGFRIVWQDRPDGAFPRLFKYSARELKALRKRK